MAWTLCTSGAAIAKAGAKASRFLVASGSTLAWISSGAEGVICAETKKDWVTNIATIGANFKGILQDCAANLIAIEIINYDKTNFGSPTEADNMIVYYRDRANEELKILRDYSNQEAMT